LTQRYISAPLYFAQDAEIIALLRGGTTCQTILGSSEYEDDGRQTLTSCGGTTAVTN
jgi:hypothetical protein